MSHLKTEVVGSVTHEEKEEVERLYNRKTALRELLLVLSEKKGEEYKDLFEKAKVDLNETETGLRNWWRKSSNKYKWKSVCGGNWKVSFKTCEVTLEYS